MSQLLYYCFIKPISYLPLSVLYLVSDFMFLIMFRLIGFRKKVVLQNLQNSFPEKSTREVEQLMEAFYRHLCDLIVEFVRLFSMPEAEVIRRCRVVNSDFLNDLYRQGKSIMIAAGHYNNWELAAVAGGAQIPHHPVGIYHPLSNRFFNKKFTQSRGKYGLGLVAKDDTKSYLKEKPERPIALIFGTDQSPHNARSAYWTYFLNQETAVMYGTEKYAREYDYPVVFGWVKKLRRGYYEITFELITDKPAESPHGAISEKHTRMLEEEILSQPQYWLWTHRRWKRERPEDIEIAGHPPIHSVMSKQ